MKDFSQLIVSFIAGATFTALAGVLVLPAISSDVQLPESDPLGMPKPPKHLRDRANIANVLEDEKCNPINRTLTDPRSPFNPQNPMFSGTCPESYNRIQIDDAKQRLKYEDMARAELIYEEQMSKWTCANWQLIGLEIPPSDCDSSNPVAFGTVDLMGSLAVTVIYDLITNPQKYNGLGEKLGAWLYEQSQTPVDPALEQLNLWYPDHYQ